MPLPEKALIETLEALRLATAAVSAVASVNSETAREALVPQADRKLAEVGRRIEELAAAAAEMPPLFGRNVGDGLDAERADAREAVALLRTLLLDHTLRSDARGGKVQASFAGSRILTAEEEALVERLTQGHVHEASAAWLEKGRRGEVALEILRRLMKVQRAEFDGPGPGGADNVAAVRHFEGAEPYLSLSGAMSLSADEANFLEALATGQLSQRERQAVSADSWG